MGYKMNPDRKAALTETLKMSHYYAGGEWFRASDIAPVLKLTVRQVGLLMSELCEDGVVQKTGTEAGRSHLYRKPKRSMLSIDWRHSPDIYELINEEGGE